jgi:hypothetical protein
MLDVIEKEACKTSSALTSSIEGLKAFSMRTWLAMSEAGRVPFE